MSDDERKAFNEEWPAKLFVGRVDLRHVAGGVRRQGTVDAAGRRARRGVRPGPGADARRLLRRHARRADDPAVGERGAEEGVPAQDPPRRDALVPGLLRAELGFRPRQPQDHGGARRRRVGDQRAEGVDDPGPQRRLLLPARRAPTRTRRSTRASRTCSCRCTSPGSRCAASPSPTARPSSARCSSPTPGARSTTSSVASTTAGRSPTRRSAFERGQSATTGYRRFEEEYRQMVEAAGENGMIDDADDPPAADALLHELSRSCASTACARCRRS